MAHLRCLLMSQLSQEGHRLRDHVIRRNPDLSETAPSILREDGLDPLVVFVSGGREREDEARVEKDHFRNAPYR